MPEIIQIEEQEGLVEEVVIETKKELSKLENDISQAVAEEEK